MTSLSGIHVHPGTAEESACHHGNAVPILHEVRHALERLIHTGESTKIDLSSIPFGPGDEERLTARLGTGEVSASIDALGPTRIHETAIPGVWLVDYRSGEDERLALHIEITTFPEILRTQPEDLAIAISALDAQLEPGQGIPRQKS